MGNAQGHCDLGRAKSLISATAESQQQGQPHAAWGNRRPPPVSLCSTENATAVRSLSNGKARSTFKPLFFKGILQDGMRFILFVSNFVCFPIHLFD